MKRSIVLSLAFALGAAPVAAFAQAAPPAPPAVVDAGPPQPGAPDLGPPGAPSRSPAQEAAMRQMRGQLQSAHAQTRLRMLAALTPAHRTAVANVVGQLVISANPDPRTAALSLDTLLAPGEKQSIVAIAQAERSNVHTLMEQQRAAFESTLTSEQRAAMTQREAQRQAFMQSHPRPAHVEDPGMILLRTLSDIGGGPGMHGRPF